jgi:hypothetical protein
MENADRLFDPEKGNFESFIVASRLRVIDVYRKEKGSRYYREWQFPLLRGERYENNIVDSKNYGIPEEEKEEIKKVLQKLSVDNSWILVNGFCGVHDDALASDLLTSKVSIQSRRHQAKKKFKEYYENDRTS